MARGMKKLVYLSTFCKIMAASKLCQRQEHKGEDGLEDINTRKAGLLLRTHLFLKRTFFFYRPWNVYWALYFGPWTWLFRGFELVRSETRWWK